MDSKAFSRLKGLRKGSTPPEPGSASGDRSEALRAMHGESPYATMTVAAIQHLHDRLTDAERQVRHLRENNDDLRCLLRAKHGEVVRLQERLALPPTPLPRCHRPENSPEHPELTSG